MLKINRTISEAEGLTPDTLSLDILTSTEPLILRGLVADWPVVREAQRSIDNVQTYIRSFYQGAPVTVFRGEPEIGGRVFYNDDLSGFNYQSSRDQLNTVLDEVLGAIGSENPPMLYMGSTQIDNWLPGFRAQNDLSLPEWDPLVSIWLGNRSRIAAHYDFPDNIACCIAGRREFTLFPPDQIDNLYVGPIDFTPAGQAISLVDFHAPDYERFPRFAEAVPHAVAAMLEPGDAIFIPSMWWHHVEALGEFNGLVNYWWRRTPAYLGTPMNVLYHALLSLRELPVSQRDAWKKILDHYVFNDSDLSIAHIPEHVRGALGATDEIAARRLRARLLNKLNR